MKSPTPLRLGSGTASMTNYLYSGAISPKPEIGMGATILMWTDRHACTIVGFTKTGVYVQEDTAIRTDSYGISESQAYAYQPNPKANRQLFTLRKNGAYVKMGQPMVGGTRLAIGVRDEYCDPSF